MKRATCPQCGKRVRFPDSMIGREAACPRCSARISLSVDPGEQAGDASEPIDAFEPKQVVDYGHFEATESTPAPPKQKQIRYLRPPESFVDRFVLLRLVAALAVALGGIVAVIAVIAGFLVLVASKPETNEQFLAALWLCVPLAGTFVTGLLMMLAGELVQVVLAIERNTRPFVVDP